MRVASFLIALSFVVPSLMAMAACAQIRSGPADGADAGADTAPPPPPPFSGPLKLEQVPDLPLVNYRAVHAVSANRVFIVGDETILEWDGSDWKITLNGGIDITGVWANETAAIAVGTFKNTNKGVIIVRSPERWIQLKTVPFGLKAVTGSRDGDDWQVVLVGNNGAIFTGGLEDPARRGIVQAELPGVPESLKQGLFFPVLPAVAANSPSAVLVAGPVATVFRFNGTEWFTGTQEGDLTRSFSAAWALPGKTVDTVVGANYYGLWRYQAPPDGGTRATMLMFHEEREQTVRANQSVLGIWGDDPERFLAVGTGGRVMFFDHPNPLRILETPAGARDLYAVSGTDWRDLWMVGDDGVVLHGAFIR